MICLLITNLIVGVSANTSKLSKNLGRAEKRVGTFGQRVGSGTKRLLGYGAALGAGYGTIAFLKNQWRLIDSTTLAAQKLGVTTEALSRLEYAALQSGVPVNTLHMALQRMTRRISEAAQGTGEAQAALKELGLDAEQLAALPIERSFALIADAMGNVENSGDKVRLAFKLFDSEGVALVNTLNLGSQRLKQMADASDALGNTIGTKMSKRVREASEALQRVGIWAGGVARAFLTTIAPAIQFVCKLFHGFYLLLRMFNATVKVAGRLAELGAKLPEWAGGGAFQRMAAGMKDFTKGLEDFYKEKMEAFEALWNKPIKVPKPIFPDFKELKDLENMVGGLGGRDLTPAALRRGTAEAYSAARKGGAGFLPTIANQGKLQVATLKDMLRELRDIERHLDRTKLAAAEL